MFEELISFIFVGLCFLFLLFRFHGNKVLYLKIFVAAIGCLFLGELYKFVYIISFGQLPEMFNLEYLGIFGSFLFFTTANYGVMDHILDDGDKKNRGKRLISLILPILIGILFLLSVYCEENKGLKIMNFMLMIPTILASYYSCKQVIFPSMELLFLKLIKPCNVLVLVMAILNGLHLLFRALENDMLNMVINYCLLCSCIVLTFLLERSRKLWKI